MKYLTILIITLLCKNLPCQEAELELEAVFQGKCSSNLCSQLCYELHDGMFECDCTQGFELNQDGYSCRASNISINVLNDNNNLNSVKNDDYSSSDVFYQKGVSFSAKLDVSEEKSDEAYENNEISNNKNVEATTTTIWHSDNQSVTLKHQERILQNISGNDATINIPRFQKSSWIAFRPLKGGNLVTEINLEFRPESLDGTIFVSGERDDLTGDFMILIINNGFVELFVDCGSGVGRIRSNNEVVLHEWNVLRIYRYRWDAWIELNDKRRIRGRSVGVFSRITFRSPIFLGGRGNLSIESLASKNFKIPEGFVGCIRKFKINGHSYDLTKTASNDLLSKTNIHECTIDSCLHVKCLHGGKCQSGSSMCLCPLGYNGNLCEKKIDLKIPMFNGTSYLRYAPLGDNSIIWLELKITIKSTKDDGLILFSGRNDVGDFIALYLNYGFVEFLYDLGSGIASVKSKYALNKNEWHTIQISRTARLAVMKVDDQPEVMTVGPNGFWHLSLPYSLNIGGVHKADILPSNMRDRESFFGCIREVEINNRKVELIDDALGGLNVYNCNDEISKCVSKGCDSIHSDPATELDENDLNLISKKYSFDIVNFGDDHDNSELIDNSISDQTFHNEMENVSKPSSEDQKSNFYQKIVRVSLNKKKSQGTCFNGNNSFILFSSNDVIKSLNSVMNDINIRFRTYSKNGLVLWTSQESNGDDNFLSLSIEDGYMHLRYNLGAEDVDIVYNFTKVNDGLWHRVRALRKNQKSTLKIDGGQTASARSRGRQKILNIDTGLYIGGVPNSSVYGIAGCISEVILNEQHLNLNASTHNVNLRANL